MIIFNGKEFLHYQPIAIDIAIISGTAANEIGNISWEEKPVIFRVLSMIQAAKANGDNVID